MRCFAILFPLLAAEGMESNLSLAYVLIGLGFLLMIAELFVPSGGIISVLSACAILIGLAMTFFHDTTTGLWTLAGVCITLPIFGALLLYYWPRTPIGKKFFLAAPDEEATVAAMPVNQELEVLRGQFGKALSALRPAGVVDFNGRRVDSITEGMMVEQGHWVRCIDVRAGKVVVRPAERPNLGELETADFD
jgi:membrane-bound ClpP family serine protease